MYNKNATEPMWFRGVAASMGLCLDLGAVLTYFESRQFYPKHGYTFIDEDHMKKEL